jgi:ABC-type lipoprotein release transport system permease subunit
MRRLLAGISGADLPIFLSIAIALTLVMLVASWIPTRRASKVDPLIALSYE